MPSIARLLRQARFNPALSAVLYVLARPAFNATGFLNVQIARKLRRNGGSAVYDEFVLHFPKNVGVEFLSSICWHGTAGFEAQTWATLRSLLKNAGTFLDIGANIGLYAVLAKKLSPDTEVIAFEPSQRLYADHRLFCQANAVTDEVHQIALSDSVGTATLFQPIEGDGSIPSSAATIIPVSWQARHLHAENTVPKTTLDAFLRGRTLKPPVVMKIDVEDHEAAVLRGAAQTIAQYRPLVVCEILPRGRRSAKDKNDTRTDAEQHENRPTVEILERLGYCAFAITSEGYFRFSGADFAGPRKFRDFLLVPQSSVDLATNYLSQAGRRTLPPLGEDADATHTA